MLILFFFYCSGDHRDLHSFPTRRSSDLSCVFHVVGMPSMRHQRVHKTIHHTLGDGEFQNFASPSVWWIDRKSTRLNSSHVRISYAVFCLKKKKRRRNMQLQRISTISVNS